MTSYKLKPGAPTHYMKGVKYGPGDVMKLPPEIKPGSWLVPMEQDQEAGASAPAASGKSKKAPADKPVEPDATGPVKSDPAPEF